MIILYDKNETEFNTYGLGVLNDVTECSVSNQINGSFELSMEILNSDALIDYVVNNNIILAPVQLDKNSTYNYMQPFRIISISKDETNKVKVKANHISYDLSNVVVEPITIDGDKGFEKSLRKIRNFKGNTNNPIWKFEINDKKIDGEAYDNSEDDIVINAPASVRALLGGDNASFVKTYKAELEFDRYKVNLYPKFKMGSNNGIILSYGENITDISKEETVESRATVLYPMYSKTESSTSSKKNFFKYYQVRITDDTKPDKYGRTWLQTQTITTKRWVTLEGAQLPMNTYQISSGDDTTSLATQQTNDGPLFIWNGDVFVDVSYVNKWEYGDASDTPGDKVMDPMEAISDIFTIYKDALHIQGNTIPNDSMSELETDKIYVVYFDSTDQPLDHDPEIKESENPYVKFYYYKTVGGMNWAVYDKYKNVELRSLAPAGIIDNKDNTDNMNGKCYVPYIVLCDANNTLNNGSKKTTRIFPCVQNFTDVTLSDFIYLGYKKLQPETYITANMAYNDSKWKTSSELENGPEADPMPIDEDETSPDYSPAPGIYYSDQSTNCNLFYIMDNKSETFKKSLVRIRRADTVKDIDQPPGPNEDRDVIYKLTIEDEKSTKTRYYKFYDNEWNEIDEKQVNLDTRFIRVLSSSIKQLSPSYPTVQSATSSKTTNVFINDVCWIKNDDRDINRPYSTYGEHSVLCKFMSKSTPPEDVILYDDTKTQGGGHFNNNYFYALQQHTTTGETTTYSYKVYQCHYDQVVSKDDEDKTTKLNSYTWKEIATRKTELGSDDKPIVIFPKKNTYYYVVDNENPNNVRFFTLEPDSGLLSKKWKELEPENFKITLFVPNVLSTNTYLEIKNAPTGATLQNGFYVSNPNSANDWIPIQSGTEEYDVMTYLSNNMDRFKGCVFVDSQYINDETVQQMALIDLTDQFDKRFSFSSTNSEDRSRQLLEFTENYYIKDTDRDPNRIVTNTDLSYIRVTDDSQFSKLLLENDHIHLGDIVTVKYDKLNINSLLRITQYEFDCISNKFKSITIGEAKEELEDKLITSGSSISELDNDKEYTSSSQVNGKINQSQTEIDERVFDSIEATIGNFSKLVADVADIGELNADVAIIKKLTLDQPIDVVDNNIDNPYQGEIVTDVYPITEEEARSQTQLSINAKKAISYNWDPNTKILDITFKSK